MNFTDNAKRLTLFSGHYGSGKTNLAVNFALELKKTHSNVALADLDIVNPYYRAKDAQNIVEQNGIRLICSNYADTNVDVPAMPAEAYALTDDRSIWGVIDVGGDDRGALALGRYAEKIAEENNYEMYFVISKYRPLTRTPEEAAEILREIESAAKIRFTGIVNNSNLGSMTTCDDILSSLEFAEDTASLCGLNVKYTGVLDTLYDKIKDTVTNAVPIKLYVKQSWLK